MREALEKSVDIASWEWIRPHEQRNVVFCISEDLDLVDVAVDLAENQVTRVQGYLAGGLLYRPRPEQIALWDGQVPVPSFRCVIVQPFVLIQAMQPVKSRESEHES